jgi:hypothetical protein
MQTYIQLFSTLNKDGKKYLVDVFKWADMTLTGDQQTQYLADKQEFGVHYANYANSGEFSTEPIYSSISANESTSPVQIGFRYFWQTALDQHPKFDYWLSQFASDPNVEYRPLTLES